jgi:hypothetical protein
MVTFLGSIIKVLHANNLGFEYTLHQEIDGKSFKGEFITITQTEDATVSRLIEYLR